MGLNKWDFSKPVFNRKDLEAHSLHHAVERGDVDSLQRLIDADIKQCISVSDSVNTTDGLLKATPLHTAAEEGNLKVCKFLIMNGNCEQRETRNRLTNQPRRARERERDCLLELTKIHLSLAEADISAKDRHGNEPLHLASAHGHTHLIHLFIVKGAMVNNRNHAGNTALHYAANKGHDRAVALLVQMGSVVSSRNGNGWTPLHLAVVSAHFETVRTLATKGGDVNSQGNTPLHLACECNNLGMVDFLVRKGAKTTIENAHGSVSFSQNLLRRPRSRLGSRSGETDRPPSSSPTHQVV